MSCTSGAVSISVLPMPSASRSVWDVKRSNSTVVWCGRSARAKWIVSVRASTLVSTDAGKGGGLQRVKSELGSLKGMLGNLRAVPNAFTKAQRAFGSKFAIVVCSTVMLLIIITRQIIVRCLRHDQGSVADLVRRGQLKSDRRGIRRQPVLFDDPFNNPLVKVDNGASTVQMLGKVYRLAPVTLTKEQQSVHQKRRSQAYQWKRPTVFLKEGDLVPPNVDPDSVRWIPVNHPFAAASTEIDEDVAKNNVFQKDGVPSRVKAEYEALQKELDASKKESIDEPFAGPQKTEAPDWPKESPSVPSSQAKGGRGAPDGVTDEQNSDATSRHGERMFDSRT